MTDKEKTIKELKEALDSLDITNKYRLNLIRAIEYLQEEPVSKQNLSNSFNIGKDCKGESVSEDLDKAAKNYAFTMSEEDEVSKYYAFLAGAKWKFERVNEALLSEVLPCFMHGGEADEVVAKLDEVLNKKK